MSNQYIHEPATNGKVCLETSLGPIDIELWSKECPKACRNFIQLCMEGYYDNCEFHTIIKDIIAQTGDPKNTGEGGASIYEKDFKIEPHQRLRFNRRGLVSMAASPDGFNGSQFFITLGPTPELNSKHTLFGKVAGNTIFNFININEAEVNSDNRPVRAEKILSTKILANPFDDIVPRRVEKRHKGKKDKRKEDNLPNTDRLSAKKNTALLSFGDELEEDEDIAPSIKKFKAKSAHDVLNDQKLSKVAAVMPEELGEYNADDRRDDEQLSRVQERLKSRKRKVNFEEPQNEQDDNIEDFDDALEAQKKIERQAELDQLTAESKALQKEYVRSLRGPKQQADPNDESKMSEGMKNYKNLKLKYKSKTEGVVKESDPQREDQTMSLLRRFQTTLTRSTVQGVLTNKKVDVSDLKTVKEVLEESAVPKKRKLPKDMLPAEEEGGSREIIVEDTIPEEIKPEFDEEAVDEADSMWLGHVLVAADTNPMASKEE